MKIAIGSDHGGLDLKKEIIDFLKAHHHEIVDFGTHNKDSCDYTDFGLMVAKEVSIGNFERGIVICTTGIGMSIIANKVRGIRCALVTDVTSARLTREHNDTNVLALGQYNVSYQTAKDIVEIWLNTSFSNGSRHLRRVDRIKAFEEE